MLIFSCKTLYGKNSANFFDSISLCFSPYNYFVDDSNCGSSGILVSLDCTFV